MTNPTFEETIERLQEVTAKMEEEALPLADLLALYKEGKKLEKCAEKLLDQAEKEVIMLQQEETFDE